MYTKMVDEKVAELPEVGSLAIYHPITITISGATTIPMIMSEEKNTITIKAGEGEKEIYYYPK